MQIKEDYYYEIMDKEDRVIDSDYVCLDSAIEHAEQNGGVIINQVWYNTETDAIIAAEIIWENK